MNKIITADLMLTLKNMKDNTVDLGITSPPYNKQEIGSGEVIKAIKYSKYVDKMKEQEYQDWQVEILDELYRVIKPGCSFFYNHKVRQVKNDLIHPMEWVTKSKWRLREEIIWDRNSACNFRGWKFWGVDERIYWLYKPIDEKDKGKELLSKHALLGSVWHIRPEGKQPNHPAPFPLEIPMRIIYSMFDDTTGKVVIDPFGGSGTTAVAAKLLGHNYISIDIDEKYNELTRERLQNCKQYEDILLKEKEKHFVAMTYKERKARRLANQLKRETKGEENE